MWRRCLFSLICCLAILFTTADCLFGFTAPRGEVVEIPSYLGVSEDALPSVEGVELICSYRHDPKTLRGVVIGQTPSAGTRQRVSDRRPCQVTLTVSLGAEEKTLPALLGHDIRQAEDALRALGFVVRSVAVKGERAGRVVEMQPPAGQALPIGSAVTLTYEKGSAERSATVPMLVGMTVEDAAFSLYLSRLCVGEVRVVEENDPLATAEGRTVLRQIPTAGSYVEAGSTVTLIVG